MTLECLCSTFHFQRSNGQRSEFDVPFSTFYFRRLTFDCLCSIIRSNIWRSIFDVMTVDVPFLTFKQSTFWPSPIKLSNIHCSSTLQYTLALLVAEHHHMKWRGLVLNLKIPLFLFLRLFVASLFLFVLSGFISVCFFSLAVPVFYFLHLFPSSLFLFLFSRFLFFVFFFFVFCLVWFQHFSVSVFTAVCFLSMFSVWFVFYLSLFSVFRSVFFYYISMFCFCLLYFHKKTSSV